MKGQPYSNFIKLEGGAELHARKGWRGASRPRGTNRRRVLTSAGLAYAPLSRASRAKVQPTLWGRFKAAAVEWVADVRAKRIAAAKAEAAALAKKMAEDAVVAHMTHA